MGRFSFPLVWDVSNSLNDICRLLENRFVGFMDIGNMQQIRWNCRLCREGQEAAKRAFYPG
ncbi:papain-like cysteine peptidase [Peribacillus muralis]|uniref:papain-like cysteine peptidase n=1 Tax=Peribacillus muralis TaxID=264697 RepID=UPI000A807F8D|nr:papain-like cysteine peptidase [Peribacillus muralis]